MKVGSRTRWAGRVSIALIGMLTLVSPGPGREAYAGSDRAPAYGGTFTVAGAQPDCLDPQKTGLAASVNIFGKVVDTLITIDPKGRYSPDLATGWKFSGGGKQLTLTLRKGVRFSNGDPFNANAVKYTFGRAVAPATKSPSTAADLKIITGVKVVNPYTVRLTLSAPSRVLLTNLALGFTGILDPKTAGSTTCEKVIGTGPFKIQSVGPGFNTVTLVRNERHTWNSPWIQNRGKAYLSKVVIKSITSPATAVSELLTGDVDYAAVPGTELSRVQGNSHIKLYRDLAQGETFMGFNFAHAPLNSTNVRKAIVEAIDTKAILQAAYQNLGVVAKSPLGKTIPYYDKNAAKYALKYSPTSARQTFSTSHVTGPFDLVVLQDPQIQSEAELIQAELGDLGVKVNVVVKAPADYFPAVAGGKFDMTILGYGYPDPDILYQLFHSSQQHGGLNFWNYSNSTVDALLTEGRENAKKARAAYASVQKIFDTQAVMMPLIDTATPAGLRTRVKGYQRNPSVGFPYQSLYIGGK